MDYIDVDMRGLSVMFGCPAGRDFHPYTVRSIIETVQACAKMGVSFTPGMVAGMSVIQWARDEVLDMFLQSDANRLFWIDSDMVWNVKDFMRLLALSTKRDIVCGAYPAKVEQPTFYVLHDQQEGMTKGEYGLFEIHGIGLGFTVMTRKACEAIAKDAPRVRDALGNKEMAGVFRIDTVDGERRGEDMAFFADLRKLGFKVWLDPEVKLGHMGMKKYEGSISNALQSVQT